MEEFVCTCPGGYPCENYVSKQGDPCKTCERVCAPEPLLKPPISKKKIKSYPCASVNGCPWMKKVYKPGLYCFNCLSIKANQKKQIATIELQEKVWKRIGLHPKLDLNTACADFYLLEKMVSEAGWVAGPSGTFEDKRFMGNERVLETLVSCESFLAKEFATYLDMALGGEIRHAAPSRANGGKYKGPRAFSPELAEYLEQVEGKTRDYAWDIWTRLRRKAPKKTLPLLAEVVKVFEGEWGRGAGGAPWAQIGRVALPYIQGTMSERSFVNLCWSLQHCNDFVFDKTYKISGLAEVLALQAEGWYDVNAYYGSEPGKYKGHTLVQYASPTIQVMWIQHRKQLHRPQGMEVPEWHGTGD